MKYKEELIKSMKWLGEKENTLFLGQATAFSGHAISGTLGDVPKDKLVELPVIEEKEKTNETDIKKDEEDVNEIKEPEPITEEKIEEPPKTKKIKTKKQINKEENINYSISDI